MYKHEMPSAKKAEAVTPDRPKFNPSTSSSFTPQRAKTPDIKNVASFKPQFETTPSAVSMATTSSKFSQMNIDALSFNPGNQTFNNATTSYAPSLDEEHVDKLPSIYPPPHSILQYHLYAPYPPPHMKPPLKANQCDTESLFIPNDLRERLLKRNQATLQVLSIPSLPETVSHYYNLVPLDYAQSTTDNYYGHTNSLYKVFSKKDGKVYCMRRIHDMGEIEPLLIAKSYQQWSKVESSNIVKLRDILTTRAFGDESLCIVTDYYANALNLNQIHFKPVGNKVEPITENLLWGYICQLTNALTEAHRVGLSLRHLCADKVLVTSSPGIIKFSEPAVHNLLNEQAVDLQADFKQFAQLIARLAAGAFSISFEDSIEDVISNTKLEDTLLKTCLEYLVSDKQDKDISEFACIIAPKMLMIMNGLVAKSEFYEGQLVTELENARLVRLITKLNAVYGRPDAGPEWTEAGEKYPIKLFHDYVFHQVDHAGHPAVDLAHVLRCLNKLDAGVEEKVMLVSADEKSCIIASYKELKTLVDMSFRQLLG